MKLCPMMRGCRVDAEFRIIGSTPLAVIAGERDEPARFPAARRGSERTGLRAADVNEV